MQNLAAATILQLASKVTLTAVLLKLALDN